MLCDIMLHCYQIGPARVVLELLVDSGTRADPLGVKFSAVFSGCHTFRREVTDQELFYLFFRLDVVPGGIRVIQ